jgi:hypothetical protein
LRRRVSGTGELCDGLGDNDANGGTASNSMRAEEEGQWGRIERNGIEEKRMEQHGIK